MAAAASGQRQHLRVAGQRRDRLRIWRFEPHGCVGDDSRTNRVDTRPAGFATDRSGSRISGRCAAPASRLAGDRRQRRFAAAQLDEFDDRDRIVRKRRGWRDDEPARSPCSGAVRGKGAVKMPIISGMKPKIKNSSTLVSIGSPPIRPTPEESQDCGRCVAACGRNYGAFQRAAARSSASLASTQFDAEPSARCSFFQNGARDFR